MSWSLPARVARESVVSVVWYRRFARFEWSDWVAHTWDGASGRRSSQRRRSSRGIPVLVVPPLVRGRRA